MQLLNLPGLNHTTKVVFTLMQPLAGCGYDLYTDRSELALELLKINTTLTSTVMTNRKNMPLAVKQKRKRAKGESKTFKKGIPYFPEYKLHP